LWDIETAKYLQSVLLIIFKVGLVDPRARKQKRLLLLSQYKRMESEKAMNLAKIFAKYHETLQEGI
jgi:hypothetical protein